MSSRKIALCFASAPVFIGVAFMAGCGGGMNPIPNPTPSHSKFLYVVDSIANSVSSFQINSARGTLTPSGPAVPADEAPIYAAASPDGKFLYVANAGSSSNGVSAYRIDPNTGVLTPTSPATFATTGDSEPLGIVVDPSSRHVYTANAGGISAFLIDPATGNLSDLPGTPVAAPPDTLFENLAITPDGRFLYVTDAQGRQVFSYTIDATGLPHGLGAPAPAGKFPEGIAVSPSGRFVYVANWNSDDVSTYVITPNTGVLVPAARTTPTQAHCGPQELAIDPASRFVFVSCAGLSSIDQFAIDPASGKLTPRANLSTGQFTQPRGLAVDASGTLVFSAWNMQNKAAAAAVGSDGALSAIPGAASTGRGPLGVALAGSQ